jgi:DNA-binding transcriptional MocR family regulator
MAGLDAEPESSAVQSAAKSPKLGDFLAELDLDMSLDWSGQSFQGLPALRENILQRTGTGAFCGVDDVLITAGAAEANFLL